MAKARMLSQDVTSDMRLKRCSLEAAFTYVCTIPFLDRDGLVSGSPSWIAGHALTERPELHTRVGSYIEEWVTQGLVTRYESNNGSVLFFHGFRKHNSNLDYRREPKSKFPPPPGYIHGEDGLLPLNPKIARTIADAYDKRNSYRIALLVHADRLQGKEASGREDADDLLEEALGNSTSHKDSGEFHRKFTGNSGEIQCLMEDKIIEDKEKDKGKGREESNSNGAKAPARPKPALSAANVSKDHPCIVAFHELHNRFPNKAQMAAIIEHDLPVEDWRRAINAWEMAGYSPTNVQGMIDWTLEPSRYEGKGSSSKEQRKTGYSDFIGNVPPPEKDKLAWRAEITRAKLNGGTS